MNTQNEKSAQSNEEDVPTKRDYGIKYGIITSITAVLISIISLVGVGDILSPNINRILMILDPSSLLWIFLRSLSFAIPGFSLGFAVGWLRGGSSRKASRGLNIDGMGTIEDIEIKRGSGSTKRKHGIKYAAAISINVFFMYLIYSSGGLVGLYIPTTALAFGIVSLPVGYGIGRYRWNNINRKREELESKLREADERIGEVGKARQLLHQSIKNYNDGEINFVEDNVETALETWKTEKDTVEKLLDVEDRVEELHGDGTAEISSVEDDIEQVYRLIERQDFARADKQIQQVEQDLEEIEVIDGLEEGKDMVQEAERKYEQGDFYGARQLFEDSTEHLERVLSDATRHGLDDVEEEAREHVMASRSNQDKAQQAMYGDGEPPQLAEPGEEVETMDASEFGGQALETPPRREVGSELRDELPEHEVLEHIGSGGNADVHKIRLKDTGEVAALKVPQWEGTLSTDVVEDFTDEAETWDKLDSHDNIVEVLNWGSAPYPWMVLEYMDGSLRETTDSLGVNEKLELLASTADALEYAHGHGVVHLDIKPENVLTSDGKPKIADWGLSQVLLTHTQTQMGLSAPYAAPEQLTDDMGKVDRQTDVYQLGVLSYEVLTGRLPFDTEKMADLQRKILEETPEPPSQVNGALPQEIDEVVLKAMAKSKDERYDAVVLFRNALQNVDVQVV